MLSRPSTISLFLLYVAWATSGCDSMADEASNLDTAPDTGRGPKDLGQKRDVGPADAVADSERVESDGGDVGTKDGDSDVADEHISTDDGPVRAFPGAMGFGADAKGGRGGRAIYVTNLQDSGTGSLRAALAQEGPRTVIFRVGGTIELDSTIRVNEPFVTIAGQTAPGGGIALRHSGVQDFGAPLMWVSTNDVVIRHLRFRRGPSAEGECCGDNLLLANAENVILDHLSFSWSTDESLNGWPAENVTVQNTLISESLRYASHEEDGKIQNHALGALFGNSSQSISFIRNVFANNTGRNPQLSPTDGGTFQIVNNFVYNTCYAMTLSSRGPRANYNAIGNLIVAGSDTCGRGRASLLLSGDVRVYVEGNLTPYRAANEDEWLATAVFLQEPPADEGLRAPNPFDAPAVEVFLAEDLEPVLLENVGATLPQRDSADLRVLSDIANRRGTIIDDPSEVGGWPVLEIGTTYPDEDGDGMDDAWERDVDLDPEADDGAVDRDQDGYTNLEEFLNGTRP